MSFSFETCSNCVYCDFSASFSVRSWLKRVTFISMRVYDPAMPVMVNIPISAPTMKT